MLDFIIVGQGLAGTSLAWALLEQNANILIVDRGDFNSASHIAAGLITPVSGRRHTLVSDFDLYKRHASRHYRKIEKLTGKHFFLEQAAIRLCFTAEDHKQHEQISIQPGPHVGDISPAVAHGIRTDLKGFQMPHAARLDVAGYLHSSRCVFDEEQQFRTMQIDTASVVVEKDHVTLNNGALSARMVVFCGGYADANNPWLPEASFEAAKGEILTVQIDGLVEPRTVHAAKLWLVPTPTPGEYLAGATYDRVNLDAKPSIAARDWISKQLKSFLTLPFQIISQQAAVRPIGAKRRPVLNRHSDSERIAWFNGLGSKGALWAPYLAHTFAENLIDKAPIQPAPASTQ